jgi:hypothetical protein
MQERVNGSDNTTLREPSPLVPRYSLVKYRGGSIGQRDPFPRFSHLRALALMEEINLHVPLARVDLVVLN